MGACNGQWIYIQNHVLPIRCQPPPTAHMHDELLVPYWEIIDDGLLGKPVRTKILHALRTVVPFIQVHVQGTGVKNLLLASPGVETLGLNPHHIEEVQHAFRQKEAEEVFVKLYLCCILIHTCKGTTLPRNGQIYIILNTEHCG